MFLTNDHDYSEKFDKNILMKTLANMIPWNTHT